MMISMVELLIKDVSELEPVDATGVISTLYYSLSGGLYSDFDETDS
jgi:hypothetical protein